MAFIMCNISLLVTFFLATFTQLGDTQLVPSQLSRSRLGIYRRAAISTDAPICAQLGREILLKNGSAADVAITTLLCMGITIPQSMGLGGGALMVHYDRTKRRATAIDAREIAPAAATRTMFQGNAKLAQEGGLSVAIPGELAGYMELHERFGRLPWQVLFEGPIRLARHGFPIGFHLANALKVEELAVRKYRGLRRTFVKSDGRLMSVGDVLKRPDLASTFEQLATNPRSFYDGAIAHKIAKEIRRSGGIITEDELYYYKPRVYEALNIMLHNGLSSYTLRPPSSGAILAFILNIMGGYSSNFYSSVQTSVEQTGLFYHRLVEAFKFAYAKRSRFGDEKFDKVEQVLDELTSIEYADTVRHRIDDKRTFNTSYYTKSSDVYIKEDHGTAHVSVIDAHGNAVSISSTINLYFGSKILSDSTGIIFNDQMDDFTSPNITNAFGVPPADDYNQIEPGKKPLSSMCPSIIVNDRTGGVHLVIGGAGGTQITTGSALVATKHLFLGQDLKKAIDEPRVHHQLLPDNIVYESGFSRQILRQLVGKGHKVKQLVGRGAVIVGLDKDRSTFQGIRLIQRNNSFIYANSDYRKGGSVGGI